MPSTTGSHNAVPALAEARNLGPRSAEIMAAAGVPDLATLRRLGAVRAFHRARQLDPRVSLNLLWALEGALLNEPWQTVAREHRTSLLLALDDLDRLRHGGMQDRCMAPASAGRGTSTSPSRRRP